MWVCELLFEELVGELCVGDICFVFEGDCFVVVDCVELFVDFGVDL